MNMRSYERNHACATIASCRITAVAVLGLIWILQGGCERQPANPPASAAVKRTSEPATHSADEPPWFADESAERGVNFTWRSGHAGRHMIPEITGGGAAMFDYNNDGWLDFYLVQAGGFDDLKRNPPSTLFRNTGAGQFAEVPNAAGADHRGFGMGAACGDVNNDGWVDLYVTCIGPNVLYRNNGGESFTDITESAGVGHPGYGSSAAFFDMDRDGDLDLYVCNYLNWAVSTERDCFNLMGQPDYCSPKNYVAPAMDVLYRNEGDGTFTDVTVAAGLDAYFGTGLGVVCADFNNDAWPDIFVANDGMRNQLWINQQNGTFVDQALTKGCAVDEEGRTKAGMGIAAMDHDDDGDLDVLIGNMRGEGDTLFVNEGEYFLDATARTGLRAATKPYTTFGLGWQDLNNDGLLDVFQVHGAITRESRVWATHDPYAQPNLLFKGSSGGTHLEVPNGGIRAGSQPAVHTSRAACFGDMDNDGGIDVLVINRDAPAYLLRNVHPQSGHWVRFRVLEGQRDAVGATMRVHIGDRVKMRTVHAAYSYLASNDPRVHIGLGDITRIDRVSVQWVDGTREFFGPFEADGDFVLHKGEGQRAE